MIILKDYSRKVLVYSSVFFTYQYQHINYS